MNEGQLLREVIALAHKHSVLVFHSYGPPVSTAGFPDLVLAGRHGVVFAELKSETGDTTAEQDLWARNLEESGAKYCLWRPEDLRTGMIEMVLQGIA